MSKRTNTIVAVTIARYATVYVEADTPDEAAKIVKDNLDEIYDEMFNTLEDQFEESDVQVDSWEAYTTECDDYMDNIWADGKALTCDEYIEELDEDDEG